MILYCLRRSSQTEHICIAVAYLLGCVWHRSKCWQNDIGRLTTWCDIRRGQG
jgi:hypothetical protein